MKLMAVYNAVKKLIGPNWYCFILPYRWEYAKIAWLTRGSAWPRHSSGAVLPGRSGWLIAWISFVLLSPEGWYGFPAESWREIRTLCRDVNFKASPYYGHVNESPRIISGWVRRVGNVARSIVKQIQATSNRISYQTRF